MKCSVLPTLLLALGLLRLDGSDAVPPIAVYRQMCDASAAVWLNETCFAVANDEDNSLRVFERDNPVPVYSMDLSIFLAVDPKEPETDIEGAARIGDTVYWITSHGRNKNGKLRPSRQRFFATKTLVEKGQTLVGPQGRSYERLLQDFLADSRLRPFGLEAASRLAPKETGGLNIEGLAAGPQGSVLIGFRNPLPGKRALIVPLLNPAEVIQGVAARLGDPILLDLEGKGIRSITEWKAQYLVVAGSVDGGGTSGIYSWLGGTDKPFRLDGELPVGLNPEALAILPGDNAVLVVSDDGTMLIGGQPCKELKDRSQKQFRTAILPLRE